MPLPLRFLASFATVAVIFPLLSSGQRNTPQSSNPQAQNSAAELKSPPVLSPSSEPGSPAQASVKPYLIGPLDVLEVKVWNDPKLSGIFDVRPDGMISMPLVGEIKADGSTVADLSKAIAGKLASVFVDAPEVNIQVIRYNSKKYFIFGEVRRPGEFPLTAQTTVMDALVNGAGFTDFASPKKIYVLRGNQKIKFNYKDVSQGRHMEQNIVLQNGDKIFVPE